MTLFIITAVVALAAFTLPGSEAGAYYKDRVPYTPDEFTLPVCPAAAVKPVVLGGSRPVSACKMIMWLHSVGAFCERV